MCGSLALYFSLYLYMFNMYYVLTEGTFEMHKWEIELERAKINARNYAKHIPYLSSLYDLA